MMLLLPDNVDELVDWDEKSGGVARSCARQNFDIFNTRKLRIHVIIVKKFAYYLFSMLFFPFANEACEYDYSTADSQVSDVGASQQHVNIAISLDFKSTRAFNNDNSAFNRRLVTHGVDSDGDSDCCKFQISVGWFSNCVEMKLN